jgi:ABC-type glycerol-3-phosphate transport system permease component
MVQSDSPGWRVARASGFAILVGLAVLFLLPIFWMVSTSVKPLDRVFALPIEWVPVEPKWDNYAIAWNRFTFGRYFANSLFVSVAVTAAHVLLAAMAGFSFAKYRFFGKRLLFIGILSTMMLPIEVVMVPTFLIVRDLGWLNSYQGLIVPVIADAFGVFLMRQFILRIPDAFIEAARIDGGSEIDIFFRIILPLSWAPALTLSVFMWRETWDSFVWPFVLITDNALRTLPLGIHRFQEEYVTTYNEVMAIAAIGMIPLTLMFFFFQRAFVQGIVLSGLKE